MNIPYGRVRFVALEDLIIKRLISVKHWRRKGDLDHAKLLAAMYGDVPDWDYMGTSAMEYDVAGLLTSLRSALNTG